MALPLGWGEALLLGPAQALHAGFPLAFPENDTTVLQDLREVGPTLLFGPPALFCRLRQEAFVAAAGAGWPWRGLLMRGLGFGDRVQVPAGPTPLTRALAIAPTRDRLGLARVRTAVCFGGIVPPQVTRFFGRLGIHLRSLDELGDAASPASVTASERAEAALRRSVFIRDAASERARGRRCGRRCA